MDLLKVLHRGKILFFDNNNKHCCLQSRTLFADSESKCEDKEES